MFILLEAFKFPVLFFLKLRRLFILLLGISIEGFLV
jgi:hypothetical protein